MGSGLTPPEFSAARVVDYAGASAVERDAAADALRLALQCVGRETSAATWAASPAAFQESIADCKRSGFSPLRSGLTVDTRTWPTADALRRHSSTWRHLAHVDAVDRQLSPRGATRLLPFILRYHDAYSIPDAGRKPTLADVPAASTNSSAALDAMIDAWTTHTRIASRARRKQAALAHAATAATRALGFALLGSCADCTLILLERPRIAIEEGQLHSWRSPAVEWRDGTNGWYWRGIRLPAGLSATGESLTAAEIARIRNVELRRLAVEFVGVGRFLASAHAVRAAQDDFGTLWRTGIPIDGEPFVAVEVVNATEEPDGTYRRYFLRVPPHVRTAREAVAWTFGFANPADYVIAAAS